MAYIDELQKEQKEINVVIKIGSDYYAQKQPDSGLVIPSENLIIDDPNINSVEVDIRRANTPVGSLNFKLKDENAYITNLIMSDTNNFLEKEAICYIGFKTGSFDFSQYKEVSRGIINSVTKISNGYSVRAKEVTSLISNPTYNITNKLNIDILAASTTLDLQDASFFPDSGLIIIEDEFIRYNGKDGDTLQNLNRGQVNSSPAPHDEGSDVYLVTEIIATNPITILLELLLSNNGDGSNHVTYDVFKNGLNISPDKINISKFEEIRDTFFLDDLYTLYLYNQNDTLKFIESEILQPTNCRIYTIDGVISLSILDQISANAEVIEVSEDVIIGVPTWSLTSDKIHNVIELSYDYDEATKKFLSTKEFLDTDSINTFGRKTPLKFRFKGIKTSLSGAAIIEKMATQLLNRLSTARGAVNVRTLFDVSNISIGDDVLLSHRFLPQKGGSLGIYDQLEMISKNLNLKDATCSFKLEYTSFTGIRVPFIAPSPLIISVIDQKTFEVPDGSCFKKDYALVLWSTVINDYLPDDVNYIQSIEGNIITMVNEFITPLDNTIRVKLADYDSASGQQKARYAYVGSNTGFFDDGTRNYQIIF